MRAVRLGWVVTVLGGLFGAGLLAVPSSTAAAEDGGAAEQRLRADATGQVIVQRGPTGDVSFVGTARGARIENPAVDRGDSVRRAAGAHLTRYAPAVGAADASTFDEAGTARTVSGVDTVRYQQRVGGVPVLGGEVVLGLGSARDLRSLRADVTASGVPTAPSVTRAAALATARALVARTHPEGDLKVHDLGRWILDPVVAGLDLPGGTRTVRRVEVGDGAAIRDLVLVDDHTGRIALHTDLIQHVDRVVCDRANVRGPETACTAGFARTQDSEPSAVADVEDAFAFSGETADFYAEVGGVDLTALLGIDVAGEPTLASTVRFCPASTSAGGCPYANAFWNGTQMYYGAGYAAADDVVGHEMTHGFVDQYSQLFYWGQSGAINESMADVVGEIVDQRNGADDDSAWLLGEVLNGGALRSMKDPTAYGDPDRTGSAQYDADPTWADGGGVHGNSGVGNKTAYLISQGTGADSFNGQTIAGIDVGDPGLTKTGRLYLDVIQRAASGTDYADLGLLLDQSCADLLAAASPGFTEATCTAVHQATVATELAQTPTNAAQPADADVSCPVGTTRQVLFDSETGTEQQQAAKLYNVTSDDPQYVRGATPGWGSNATSGTASWFVPDTRTGSLSVLRAAAPIALPAGQESYLTFQGWYLVDHADGVYYDGGLVQLKVDGAFTYPSGADTWVNGPNRPLYSGPGSVGGNGWTVFSGDSKGWVRSRLDLSDKGGHTVTPQFNFHTDNDPVGYDFSMIGWFLDDIQVYTCTPPPGPVAGLSTTGTPRTSANGPVRQRISWKQPLVNPSSVIGYRVLVDGVLRATTGPSARSVDLALSTNARHTVSVRALGLEGYQAAGVSASTVPSALSLTLARSGTTVKLSGSLKRAGSGFGGQKVWIERKSGTSWTAVGSTTTTTSGAYVLKTTRSTQATYRVRFAGAPATTGVFSPNRTG